MLSSASQVGLKPLESNAVNAKTKTSLAAFRQWVAHEHFKFTSVLLDFALILWNHKTCQCRHHCSVNMTLRKEEKIIEKVVVA